MKYKYIWEDPRQFKVNKEDGHAIAMPFDTCEDALSGETSAADAAASPFKPTWTFDDLSGLRAALLPG